MRIPKRLYIKEIYGCVQCPEYKYWPDAYDIKNARHQCLRTGKSINISGGVKWIMDYNTFPDFCPLVEA